MAAQAHALDPFSHRSDDAAVGGGLGLYLVRQIVLAMGGVIETRSLGDGTQVTLRVPATRFAAPRHPGA
jgi:signal transduction histidine kinase